MANGLDEMNDPVLEEGRDVNVIAKSLPVTCGWGTKFFEVLMWILFIIPGIVLTVKKIHAKVELQQIEQKLQHDASQIDNYLEQRVVILSNLAKLVEKAVNLDKETYTAIAEARRVSIPVFGLVDTNCDPDDVDYVIPANDDAIRSVKLIVATLANAVVEANGGTPIEIVFTDEPVAEEPKPRKEREFKAKGQKRAPRAERKDREDKPYRIKKEADASEVVEEAKEEAVAEAQEEVKAEEVQEEAKAE